MNNTERHPVQKALFEAADTSQVAPVFSRTASAFEAHGWHRVADAYRAAEDDIFPRDRRQLQFDFMAPLPTTLSALARRDISPGKFTNLGLT